MVRAEPPTTRRTLWPGRTIQGPTPAWVPPRPCRPHPHPGRARRAGTRISLSSRLPSPLPSPLPPPLPLPPPPRDYIHFDPSARRGPSGPPMDGSFSWDHSSPGLPTQSRRLHVPSLHRGHGHSATPVTSLGSGRHGSRGKTSSCAARLLAHRAPATGPALARRIPPGSGAYHRPTPFRDRSRPGAMLGPCRLGLP